MNKTLLALGFASCSLTPLSLQAGEACDLERGARMWAKCAVCHANDASSRGGVGPNLYGVIGRDIANEKDYPYSLEMEQREGTWTIEMLDRFIANPMKDLPGTMMAFAGLRKAQDRRDLICYLQQ
jgi:cytochrome c